MPRDSNIIFWTRDELRQEIARLKAEVTDLKSASDGFKAEVEALMTSPTSRLLRSERDENARLKAEVDKLKRAGDLMLKHASANMPYPPYVTIAKDWNSAKEGKQ